MREQVLGSSTDDRLEPPVPGGISFTRDERRNVDHSATIAGWGSDMDRNVRPGVPRDKAPDIGSEMLYPDIERQQPPHRIHKSTEHGQMTPVFGTSCPPRGLSGKLRDAGYQWSEGRLIRWITLMLADRVDTVEGVVSDLARFKPPNLIRETGVVSEWRHNRKGVLKAAAITMVALGAAYLLARRGRRP
jgi:hypothetical protein